MKNTKCFGHLKDRRRTIYFKWTKRENFTQRTFVVVVVITTY